MAEANNNQLLTDLHAHSENIFSLWPSEKVGYTPTQLVKRVAKMRFEAAANETPFEQILGGIALTGHDTVSGVSEALEAGEEHHVTVTPGVEITSRPGKYGPTGVHIIALLPIAEALGLESTGATLALPTLRGRKHVMDWAHDRGAVVIAAHPKRKGDNVSFSYKQLGKYAERLDGIETAFRCGLNRSEELTELADAYGFAKIGSSDAHKRKHIGVAATRIMGLPDFFTSDDVITAIRERRTEAVVLRRPTEKDMVEGPLKSQIRRSKESRAIKKGLMPVEVGTL